MLKKNKKTVAIALNAVSKSYILHHHKPTFAERVLHGFRYERFVALKKVDLKIYQGEKVGIIGNNGSGKTTLLKIIAGIAVPTSGSVRTMGEVVSLIDLDSGFHPDLSGVENIFLNGLLIGMTKEKIEEKFTEIVDFADIGAYIDEPLYTYSEGMKLRLGFSIAAHADPDILILDEGISVGDQDFQEKSLKKIEEFFKAKKTIIVVTHDLNFLEENADKIIWIEKGKVKAVGGISVINHYKME